MPKRSSSYNTLLHAIGEPRQATRQSQQSTDPELDVQLDGQADVVDSTTELGEYRPEEFLIPASDHQGHKEKRWFEIAPGYANQIGTVLASKRFPYRSEGSFIRHAIHRHLRWLATLEPLNANVIAVLESINRTVHTQELMLEFAESLTKVEKTIYDLTMRGMRAEAKRMVWEIRRQAGEIDMPAWRARYLEDIQERFGYLMVGDAVSLGQDPGSVTRGPSAARVVSDDGVQFEQFGDEGCEGDELSDESCDGEGEDSDAETL